MINEVIKKIINEEKLSETDLLETFDEVFSGVADEISSTSVITLLSAYLKRIDDKDFKGVVSCIKSANNALTNINPEVDFKYLLQSVEFNPKNRFLSVFFARDIILSANNVPVVRYGYCSPIEENEILKFIKKMQIPAVRKNEKKYNLEDFEKTNYCYVVLDETENYYKYTRNISKKLCFENILNYADKMVNPCNAKNIIIGLNNVNDVEKLAKICIDLGYQNSLVISSNNNLPIVSPEEESYIAEAWKNKIFAYKLSNELAGVDSHPVSDVLTNSIEEDIETINNLFQYKKDFKALYDTVIVNSALALYIVKKADSIMDGIDMAKKTIDSNLAYEKFISLKQM